MDGGDWLFHRLLRRHRAGIRHGNSGNILAPAFAAALAQPASVQGRQSRPVAWPGFKPGGGRQPFLGEFDSHCLPPTLLQQIMIPSWGIRSLLASTSSGASTFSDWMLCQNISCG